MALSSAIFEAAAYGALAVKAGSERVDWRTGPLPAMAMLSCEAGEAMERISRQAPCWRAGDRVAGIAAAQNVTLAGA